MKITLFKKIGLFLRKQEEPFYFLKKTLGFSPINLELYKLALIHKSSAVTDHSGRSINNERLEFLGDAILDSVVADTLYYKYPTKNEGFLTNARAKIVNRSNLNSIAKHINLQEIVQTTNSSPRSNILGNAFEALIGAIYLDLGYDYCHQFIQEKIFTGIIDLEHTTASEQNFKSRLLEWSQKNRKELEFQLVSEEISNKNIPHFVSQVLIDGETYATGEGKSKKESHQKAAQITLAHLKQEGSIQ